VKQSKQKKNTVAQNIKGKWEEKRMHGQFPRSLDEQLLDKEQSYDGCSVETLREKQKVQLWQLRIRQSAQTTLREKYRKNKLKLDVNYVMNTKKLLTN
jgi:hypothetical protein